ncbi:HopJ type III effector protein [Halioxenophilus aromaticivorans]|uniref:HopJ type III effector protein n=1 Tax=Halioxenophilus aromaticivorans TaxID=1306992 RepID=A0AAV3U6H3_9ALTE
MTLEEFLSQLQSDPQAIAFNDTIAVIDSHYNFTETAFANGDLQNLAGQNNGSCKIFAFGQLHSLSPEHTLQCFGDFYRRDVLENPDGADHQNIRNFMQHQWQGIAFDSQALTNK